MACGLFGNHSAKAVQSGATIASRDPALALAESESEKREVRSPETESHGEVYGEWMVIVIDYSVIIGF